MLLFVFQYQGQQGQQASTPEQQQMWAQYYQVRGYSIPSMGRKTSTTREATASGFVGQNGPN